MIETESGILTILVDGTELVETDDGRLIGVNGGYNNASNPRMDIGDRIQFKRIRGAAVIVDDADPVETSARLRESILEALDNPLSADEFEALIEELRHHRIRRSDETDSNQRDAVWRLVIAVDESADDDDEFRLGEEVSIIGMESGSGPVSGKVVSIGNAAEDPGPYGSSFDDFLVEHGIFEETHNRAVKSVLAWQLEQALQESGKER